MTKYIIDATNGTILNMNDCYIVDAELLGDDIILSDSEAQELANKHGISVAKMARDTGFGDNAYCYTVSYSPLSIKDEADSLLEGGIYEESDREYEALVWAKDADPEDLRVISDSIMNQDAVWNEFRENLTEMLVFVHAFKKEEINLLPIDGGGKETK
jgi:hypothetical protein